MTVAYTDLVLERVAENVVSGVKNPIKKASKEAFFWWTPPQGLPAYTRLRYSPVRVSISTLSP